VGKEFVYCIGTLHLIDFSEKSYKEVLSAKVLEGRGRRSFDPS
jgi:hypothetical protein